MGGKLHRCRKHARLQDEWQRELQGPPQERISAVRPFWEALSQQERVDLLTLSLDELRPRAKEIADSRRKQAGTTLFIHLHGFTYAFAMVT